MNLRLCILSLLYVVTLYARAADGDLPESQDGVRFDVHAATNGFFIVARGRPDQNAQVLTAALERRAKALCSESTLKEPPKQANYEHLEGGGQFLMPAGGTFIPHTSYNNVRLAPSASASVACADAISATPEPKLRLSISNRLGETIAYIDQGFASFNRERLDVPMDGNSMSMVITDAVKSALLARGYDVEVVDTADAPLARIVVSKAPVPHEQFDGIAMLTKIGLLGIQNLSAAFCSIQVSVGTMRTSTPLSIGGVSTREFLPAIYLSWKQDMASGPSAPTHAKTSALLASTLANNVKAAIHALPANTIKSIFVANAR